MSNADFKVRGEVEVDAGKAQQGLDSLTSMIKNMGLAALFMEGTKAVIELGEAIIQVGSDFETSMAKVETLFQGTTEEFAALQSDILATSNATGQSAKTLAEAAYSAESAGVAQEDLATMIDSSCKLAVAGFTDVDTALSATAKTMNAYGMSGSASIDKVQKVLIQTQNLGITTVDELGQSLAQVTPTAAAFGVNFEQVGAALAGMTAQGTSTAQATTQLNSLIAELGKNGTTASNNLMKAAEGTQYAGMSFSEMMESGATLNEVLDMMGAYADESGLSMVDMFSSIEAGKAAMSIDASDFVSNLEAMKTEADVVGEGYATMADTFEFQSQRLQTEAQNLGIAIFTSMQENLTGMMTYAADTLSVLIDTYKEQGLGGLLGAIAQIIVEGIPKLITGLTDLIMRGVAYLKGDGADQMFDSGTNLFHQAVEGIASTLPDLLSAIGQLIIQAVMTLISHIPDFLGAGVELILGLVRGIVFGAWDLIQAFISPLTEAWSNVTNFGWSGLGGNIIWGIVSGIWNSAGALWDALVGAVSNAWDGALRWLGIRSPSRRARDEIGGNVMKGMAIGFEEDNTAEAAITQQAHDIIAAAQAELNQSQWRLGNVLVDTNGTAEQRLNASWTGESTTIIELDGHELARASAPYLDEQLAFEGV